jgi:hypothetical protein
MSKRQRSKVVNLIHKGYQIVGREGGVVLMSLGRLLQFVTPEGRSWAVQSGAE